MTSPSVTYNFVNGTTADGDQVDQNFSDLIAAMTDGTKTFSIDGLTVAGTTLLNGAVTLGNASGDDITVTGSLAATMLVKTDNSFNLGDTTHAMAIGFFRLLKGSSTAGCATLGATDGAAVAAGYIGEIITCTITTTNGGNAAFADVTNAAITLSAGRWLICYSVTVEVTTNNASSNKTQLTVIVTDNANALITNTARIAAINTGSNFAQQIEVNLSAQAPVNITGSTTYKLRSKRVDSGTGGTSRVLNGTDEQSDFYAIRIA